MNSLQTAVFERLVDLGLECEKKEDHIVFRLGEKTRKLSFSQTEHLDPYQVYVRARSRAFDFSSRTLTHNTSVEVALVRLGTTLIYGQYESSPFEDQFGNKIIVGPPSIFYKFAHFFSPAYLEFFERFRPVLERRSFNSHMFNEFLPSPFTAQYISKGKKVPLDIKERAVGAINRTLFKLAAEHHECWAIYRQRTKSKIAANRTPLKGDTLIPSASYDENVISYYKVAKSSPFPSQSFVAYYNVLEYYFLTVSELTIHHRLSAILNDPAFRTTTASLDKVVSVVRGQSAKSDETELLRAVLDRFLSEEDLEAFIQEIEAQCGDKIYTKKRKLFGEDLSISLTPGHIVSNTAKLLKHVRNAIVHSSDRYKREECHIPLSDSESLIEEFLPLIRFLAEKVIYGTAA